MGVHLTQESVKRQLTVSDIRKSPYLGLLNFPGRNANAERSKSPSANSLI